MNQQQQDNCTLASNTIPMDYKRRMHEKWLQQQATALKQQQAVSLPPPLQEEEEESNFLSAASDEPTPLATEQHVQQDSDLAYAQQVQQELYNDQQEEQQVREPEPQYVRRLLPPRPTLWQSLKNWFLAAPKQQAAAVTQPPVILEEEKSQE